MTTVGETGAHYYGALEAELNVKLAAQFASAPGANAAADVASIVKAIFPSATVMTPDATYTPSARVLVVAQTTGVVAFTLANTNVLHLTVGDFIAIITDQAVSQNSSGTTATAWAFQIP